MNLETGKNLGGIGAILMFVGVLPIANTYGLLELAGLVLVLAAMYGLARHYSEGGIFNNALYGVITAIVGFVLFAIVAVYSLVGFFAELGFSIGMGNFTDWMMGFTNMDWNGFGLSLISNFLVYILLALVVLFVFVVIAAVFLRKSLGLLSAKTGIVLFGTTGLMILIGAVLTIIVIGVLLIWIGLLLLAIAFFQIKTQNSQPLPPQP